MQFSVFPGYKWGNCLDHKALHKYDSLHVFEIYQYPGGKQVKKVNLVLASLIILATLNFYSCSEAEIVLDATPSMVVHYFDLPDEEIQTVDTKALVDIEYTWKLGPNFKAPGKNLRAFVHFRDNTGNLLRAEDGSTIQDDHDFEVPISKWKAEEDVVYTRKNFRFDDSLGNKYFLVKVYMGLYDPNTMDRATLNTDNEEENEGKAYHVATFRIRRNPKIYPRYNESWHGPEPENKEHRWTKETSFVTFIRDKKARAAKLVIEGHSPVEDLDVKEQRLSIYIHEKSPEFLITKEPIIFDGERLPLTAFPIPPELYENFLERDIRFIFEVDHAYLPSNDDKRDALGFQVLQMWLQPMNPEH